MLVKLIENLELSLAVELPVNWILDEK